MERVDAKRGLHAPEIIGVLAHLMEGWGASRYKVWMRLIEAAVSQIKNTREHKEATVVPMSLRW